MRATRLIFVEGIIGSGKSTTARFIARQIERNGLPARFIFEGGRRPHPTRMMRDLPRPLTPWLDLTPAEYRARAIEKWRTFVEQARQSDTVAVFDGQLFHGNLTDLLLMDSPEAELRAYVAETLAITAELNPTLIYLYQDDLDGAIRRVIAERGRPWQEYQVNWKTRSPYAERRGLSGLDGLIGFYRAYRLVTDELVAGLDIDTLPIENAAGEWPDYRRQILTFLGLPLVDDTDLSWWPDPYLPASGVWSTDAGHQMVTTGQSVPELAGFDDAMVGLLRRWQLPGAALAMTVDGRLVLARGYGLASVEESAPVQPDTRFRIGSISKPITATAILQLVEQERLDLDAAALPLLDHLAPPAGAQVDSRIWNITIRHLLQHAGGWDCRQSFDPLLDPRTVDLARAAGLPEPIGAETVIRVMLGQPLDFDPGTRFSYSNLGYCILGRVVEKLTGQAYDDVVKTEVLRPLGIERMQIATTMVEGLADGEARYYDPGATTVAPNAPWWSFRTLDSVGGWIGSAIDVVHFMAALDGQRGARPLRPETVQMIAEPPPRPLWINDRLYYGLGWHVSPDAAGPICWHSGLSARYWALASRGRRGGRGITRAVLFNSRPEDVESFTHEVNQGLGRAGRAVTEWPAHDLFDTYA